MTPIELLQKKLDRLLSARNHSIKSLEEGVINDDKHEMHIIHLHPQIENYDFAIKILKKYT